MAPTPKSFIWYELMTTDMDAAIPFYSKVVGWRPQPYEKSPVRYTVMNVGDRGVGGVMPLPDEYRKAGGKPAWIGYIYSDDVDKSVESVKRAGGSVMREPTDIPEIGRFAVVADPQGAAFMLFKPMGPDQPAVEPGTAGYVGWHELYTTDWEKAFDFYSSQFGWTKGDAMDMGAMGKYQLFKAGGEAIGGIMNKPPNVPVPAWGFYFNVPTLDAASAKVTEGGGKIVNGPMEVPGGSWIVNCMDPQGAMFSLVATKR
jgi:predicted enzyme related to lactoylglutathione lyase